MKSKFSFIFIWIALIFLTLFFVGQGKKTQEAKNNIMHSELVSLAGSGKVKELTFHQGKNEITGKFQSSHLKGASFKAVGPSDDASLLKLLQKNNIKYTFKKEPKPSFLQTVLLSWLPIIAILAIFFLFMRQLQSGSSKAMSFGQSRAKLFNENQSKVRFKDVAGCDEAKQELEEVVEFLKTPKKFTRLGGKIPKGVLLIGPPGTGKTLLAKAVAGEASVPFFSIAGSDFVEMFVGVGASRVRSLFENAKKAAPCLVFIDEIDAVGRHRGAGVGGGHDEREQTLNQLLVGMDGFDGTEGIIIIAATNRADVLDPALLRPGRFDRRVTVPKPDLKGRLEVLEVHGKKVPAHEDVDFEVIARGTPGFSGADLANLVNEAALNAARRDGEKVRLIDFDEAKDKVSIGAARKSMIMSEDERRHTAYHEAGHALLARLIPENDPVYKVTIIPRGPALGVTMTLPTEDRYTMTRKKAEAMIAFMMGGRVAEELIFGHLTTGASNDIQRATELAKRMVTEWGMSDKLGPLNYSQGGDSVFLGKDMAASKHFSDDTAQEIDSEIRGIIDRNYRKAVQVMKENESYLHAMSEALLSYETIDSSDIDVIMTGKTLVKDISPKKKTKSLDRLDEKKSEDEIAEKKKLQINKPIKV